MTLHLSKRLPAGAVPIHVVDRAGFAEQAKSVGESQRRWMGSVGFSGAPDTHVLLPAADGSLAAVWAGVRAADHPMGLAALPGALPSGRARPRQHPCRAHGARRALGGRRDAGQGAQGEVPARSSATRC
jgi:hypothetical protein